jgi:hypothetical protein
MSPVDDLDERSRPLDLLESHIAVSTRVVSLLAMMRDSCLALAQRRGAMSAADATSLAEQMESARLEQQAFIDRLQRIYDGMLTPEPHERVQ